MLARTPVHERARSRVSACFSPHSALPLEACNEASRGPPKAEAKGRHGESLPHQNTLDERERSTRISPSIGTRLEPPLTLSLGSGDRLTCDALVICHTAARVSLKDEEGRETGSSWLIEFPELGRMHAWFSFRVFQERKTRRWLSRASLRLFF